MTTTEAGGPILSTPSQIVKRRNHAEVNAAHTDTRALWWDFHLFHSISLFTPDQYFMLCESFSCSQYIIISSLHIYLLSYILLLYCIHFGCNLFWKFVFNFYADLLWLKGTSAQQFSPPDRPIPEGFKLRQIDLETEAEYQYCSTTWMIRFAEIPQYFKTLISHFPNYCLTNR